MARETNPGWGSRLAVGRKALAPRLSKRAFARTLVDSETGEPVNRQTYSDWENKDRWPGEDKLLRIFLGHPEVKRRRLDGRSLVNWFTSAEGNPPFGASPPTPADAAMAPNPDKVELIAAGYDIGLLYRLTTELATFAAKASDEIARGNWNPPPAVFDLIRQSLILRNALAHDSIGRR